MTRYHRDGYGGGAAAPHWPGPGVTASLSLSRSQRRTGPEPGRYVRDRCRRAVQLIAAAPAACPPGAAAGLAARRWRPARHGAAGWAVTAVVGPDVQVCRHQGTHRAGVLVAVAAAACVTVAARPCRAQ